MDVHCTTCGEPWDVDHLRYDAIYEAGMSQEEAEAWHSLPPGQKLNARYRQAFHTAGWEFGRSVINVIRCPCCPKDAQPDINRLHTKAALEEMLGDGEDGLAATFEDHQL
ncbi:MAG: hypothetical protein KGJ60_02505 [Verrucomicrobiota bacterium]|nr:hypothetical protein [Verrucomicrobiota bacterium]